MVFHEGVSVYGPKLIHDNSKVTFSASTYSPGKKYKLILIKQSSSWITAYYIKSLDWYDRHFRANEHRDDTFEVNIELNGISVFAKDEIAKNSMRVEKFVNLKSENELKFKFEHSQRNKYKLEITEVDFVKDTQAPEIAATIDSTGLTNNSQLPVKISDISGEVTTYVWKVMPQAQIAPVTAGTVNQLIITTTQRSFNIPLTEGVNYFIVQSVDRFNNRSEFVYLNNIVLDTVAPLPVLISPAALASDYTYGVPYVKQIFVRFSEKVKSVSINGITATIDSNITGKSAYANVPISQSGEALIQIVASDFAGNTTQFTHIFNVVLVTTPPVLSITYPVNFTTKENRINLPFSIQSQVPTKSIILLNGVEVFSTFNSSASPEVNLLFEGVNRIEIKVFYAVDGFDTGLKASEAFAVERDTVAPQIASSLPENGSTIYTNHLPMTIPVSILFSEYLSGISVNNVINQPTFYNSYNTNYFVFSAGTQQLQIHATDRAGNIGHLTHSLNVDFSDAVPVLDFSASVKELLTNKISVPISGTSDKTLTSASLNGQPISVSADGKTFTGTFSAPKNGRFKLTVAGVDRYGNVGTTSTFIRVLQGLPDSLLPPKAPSLVYVDETKSYIPDFGHQFTQPESTGICAALDNIFEQDEEFKNNLANLEANLHAADSEGVTLQIPLQQDLENFMGDVEERLNYIKAPYLMMCKGINIVPNSDCPTNRKLFKLVMGSYPEPLIIKSIPGLAPSVQNFLIKRYNICTGFDDSGLSCNDMVEFLPLIADFVFPGVGQVMSSPAGQAISKALICDELCNTPIAKTTLVCTQLALPKVPSISSPTPISLPPRLRDGGGDDWGNGGGFPGGGGGGCSWFDPCDDGGGGSGAGGDGSFLCARYPMLWLCGPNGENTRDRITIDSGIDCDSLNNSKFGDIYSVAASRGISVTELYSSYMAKCFKSPVPGFPKITKPVLTITAPVQNQQVTDTVRVTGYVDDIYAQVKINGQLVQTKISVLGGAFDVAIATPVDGIVRVEAADLFMNRAVPVEVVLSLQTHVGGETPLALVAGNVWSFAESVSTGIIASDVSAAGNGRAAAPFLARRIVLSANSTVTDASFSLRKFAGGGNASAYFVSDLANAPNMSDIKSASGVVNLSLIAETFAPIPFLFYPVTVPAGTYWLVLSLPGGIAIELSNANDSLKSFDSGASWTGDAPGAGLSVNYVLNGSIDTSSVTLSVNAFVRSAGVASTSNKISAFTSTLAVGEVIYTILNSTNIPGTLTLIKAKIELVPNNSNIFVIVRRTSENIYVSNDLLYNE